MFDNQQESLFIKIVCLVLHAVLSWSSLLLPLPKLRNHSSPMIWPEFRYHSILFATRHVLISILNLMSDNYPLTMKIIIKCCILVSANLIARFITSKFGDNDNRTTNSMPYPSTISVSNQQKIKFEYALYQLGATLLCLTDNTLLSFMPILAIQIAPLLMTLVRKGLINALKYHQIYALTLSLNTLILSYGVFYNYIDFNFYTVLAITDKCISILRFKCKLPPEILWAIVSIIFISYNTFFSSQIKLFFEAYNIDSNMIFYISLPIQLFINNFYSLFFK